MDLWSLVEIEKEDDEGPEQVVDSRTLTEKTDRFTKMESTGKVWR